MYRLPPPLPRQWHRASPPLEPRCRNWIGTPPEVVWPKELTMNNYDSHVTSVNGVSCTGKHEKKEREKRSHTPIDREAKNNYQIGALRYLYKSRKWTLKIKKLFLLGVGISPPSPCLAPEKKKLSAFDFVFRAPKELRGNHFPSVPARHDSVSWKIDTA